MTESIYDATGGSPALLRLAHAWHARCLDDPIVSHAFAHGYHRLHSERLAAYWAEALGGPSDYSAAMGDESTVVRIHSGMGEHDEMDERAQVLFLLALDDADIPDDPRLRRSLTDYFRRTTEAFAAHPESSYEVPDGLPIPRWSWDGPLGWSG